MGNARGAMVLEITGGEFSAPGRMIAHADLNPEFRSGDTWLAEVELDGEKPVVKPVSIWIDPSSGAIKVTPLGHIRRKPFTIVNKWLVRLDLT